MFDIEKYIASGILENYCLGLASSEEVAKLEHYCRQYPDLKKDLILLQKDLINYTGQYSKTPPINAGHKILNRIEELKLNSETLSNDKKRIKEFIAISDFSNIDKWQKLIGHIQPPEKYENIHFHKLYKNDTQLQGIVWFRKEIEEESHDSLKEKFLVLEGTCTCKVGGEHIDMVPGSFLDIPLHTKHELMVTSKTPVKVILTKEKLAA